MGIFDVMKDAITVVQKADNIDLMRTMMTVQTEAMALVEENQNLKSEIRVLRERLETREALTFKRNAYWRSDADGPYCSRCWDSDSKLVHLHVQAGYAPQCPTCNNVAADPDSRRGPDFEVIDPWG